MITIAEMTGQLTLFSVLNASALSRALVSCPTSDVERCCRDMGRSFRLNVALYHTTTRLTGMACLLLHISHHYSAYWHVPPSVAHITQLLGLLACPAFCCTYHTTTRLTGMTCLLLHISHNYSAYEHDQPSAAHINTTTRLTGMTCLLLHISHNYSAYWYDLPSAAHITQLLGLRA